MSTSTSTNNLSNSLQLLNTEAAAKILELEPRTLENWRTLGRGPRFVKCGRYVRYRISDLLNYLDSATRSHTGEAA